MAPTRRRLRAPARRECGRKHPGFCDQDHAHLRDVYTAIRDKVVALESAEKAGSVLLRFDIEKPVDSEFVPVEVSHFLFASFRGKPRYIATYLPCVLDDGSFGDGQYTVVCNAVRESVVDMGDGNPDGWWSVEAVTSFKLARVIAEGVHRHSHVGPRPRLKLAIMHHTIGRTLAHSVVDGVEQEVAADLLFCDVVACGPEQLVQVEAQLDPLDVLHQAGGRGRPSRSRRNLAADAPRRDDDVGDPLDILGGDLEIDAALEDQPGHPEGDVALAGDPGLDWWFQQPPRRRLVGRRAGRAARLARRMDIDHGAAQPGPLVAVEEGDDLLDLLNGGHDEPEPADILALVDNDVDSACSDSQAGYATDSDGTSQGDFFGEEDGEDGTMENEDDRHTDIDPDEDALLRLAAEDPSKKSDGVFAECDAVEGSAGPPSIWVT